MLHDGGDGIVPHLVLLENNAGIRIGHHVLNGMLAVVHIQRYKLQNRVNHLGSGVALCLNADGIRGFGDRRIEMIGNHDQIPVSGIGKCFQQIGADNIRNSSKHLSSSFKN